MNLNDFAKPFEGVVYEPYRKNNERLDEINARIQTLSFGDNAPNGVLQHQRAPPTFNRNTTRQKVFPAIQTQYHNNQTAEEYDRATNHNNGDNNFQNSLQTSPPEPTLQYIPNLGKIGAPLSGYDVEKETALQNRVFALQKKCNQNVYVPSSTSDLYKVAVYGRQEEQPHNHFMYNNKGGFINTRAVPTTTTQQQQFNNNIGSRMTGVSARS